MTAIMFVLLIEPILPSKQQKNSITSPFQQDQLVGKFFEAPGSKKIEKLMTVLPNF